MLDGGKVLHIGLHGVPSSQVLHRNQPLLLMFILQDGAVIRVLRIKVLSTLGRQNKGAVMLMRVHFGNGFIPGPLVHLGHPFQVQISHL